MAFVQNLKIDVQDRQALEDLFLGYLYAVDSLSDLDGMLCLFTEDVSLALGPIGLPLLKGHSALRSFFSEIFGHMSHHAHYG